MSACTELEISEFDTVALKAIVTHSEAWGRIWVRSEEGVTLAWDDSEKK
jgi:hypothetical protein